jgi:hypothetical protein
MFTAMRRASSSVSIERAPRPARGGAEVAATPKKRTSGLAYIEEVRPATTGRDLPRPAATGVAAEEGRDDRRQETSTNPDQSRPAATAYVERVESENAFLRQQIGVKDEQIKDLTERAREAGVPFWPLCRFRSSPPPRVNSHNTQSGVT